MLFNYASPLNPPPFSVCFLLLDKHFDDLENMADKRSRGVRVSRSWSKPPTLPVSAAALSICSGSTSSAYHTASTPPMLAFPPFRLATMFTAWTQLRATESRWRKKRTKMDEEAEEVPEAAARRAQFRRK